MYFKEKWNKEEFNGYLNSLKYICDKKGVDYFSITNECDLNRAQKLYNLDLHGSNYIARVLWSEDFEKDLEILKEDNKSLHHRKQKHLENKAILYDQLKKARIDYCGVGTKKIKTFLNQEGEFDRKAMILRLLLEIEDVNITAKNSYGDFAAYRYYEKENLIDELIEICRDYGFNHGYNKSDLPSIKHIVFFDIYGKQFSWHSNMEFNKTPLYEKPWDELENSNLFKIEQLILEAYQEDINQIL